jgi:hypothetical protein
MVGDLPYAQRIAWRRHRLLWVSQGVRLRQAWRTGQREGVCALQALFGLALKGSDPLHIPHHPLGRHMDGSKTRTRDAPGVPETEMITVNLGYVDLGQVDVMVQEGFTPTAPTSSRTAIRNQLERHPDLVKDHDDSAIDLSASFAQLKAPIAQFASTRIRRRGSLRRWRCHA